MMYAGDCIFYFASNDINQLYSKFNSYFNHIYTWLYCKYLTLNFYKSVIISLKTLNFDFKLIFNDYIIHRKNSFKFSGLTIDSKVKIHKNISDIVCKVSKSRGILIKLNYF